MDALTTVAALIVTLGILVTIHEYGHFWVARKCGVRVIQFSIGFGKPLFGWTDRLGTRFVVAAIPLGGYVQMLDEREGDVPADALDQAFNRKSLGQRTAIVMAGPLANFIFAIFAYWLMFSVGISSVVPILGPMSEDSAVDSFGLQEGHEIIAVDGVKTPTWDAINLRLVRRLGETGEISIRTRVPDSQRELETRIPIERWLIGVDRPDPIDALGIRPWRPEIPARIGAVESGGRAAQGDLRPGDLVLSVSGEQVEDWMHWVELVRANPEQSIRVLVEREQQQLYLQIRPAARETDSGEQIGVIGAAVQAVEWPDAHLREIRYGPIAAVGEAVSKTWQMSVLTLDALWKMLEGLVSVKNLSGPITIAKVAGASASSGLESFLGFLAYLSISLGVLNLLPIPVLDGGHLMYYFIELVKGRPVSAEAQMFGLRIGLIIIVGIMALAFYNDLRLL